MSVHRTSIILSVLTFGLIVWGGHVNTTHSGMAFPDWPTSNTNPMLTYAPSQWWMQGEKFWEHGHRLFASLVGIVTVALTLLAWRATPANQRPNGVIGGFLLLVLGTVSSAIIGLQSMPTGFMESFMFAIGGTAIAFVVAAFRASGQRQLLWLSLAGFATVCLQGAFGGYTVRHNLPDWTSTTHGMLAEVFFMIVLSIVYLSSAKRTAETDERTTIGNPLLNRVVVGTWVLIGAQFLLGALTRHTDSWSASQHWPMWTQGSVLPTAEMWAFPQVVIHFIHRTTAYLVAGAVVWQLWLSWRSPLRIPALASLALVLVQITLGAHIIWTLRGELVTTLHVMVGVAMLALNAMMSFRFLLKPSAIPHAEELATMLGARS
jgi:cytochrome c oxidase assembly protein subunit 15